MARVLLMEIARVAKFIEQMCWSLLRLHFLNKKMLGDQFRKFISRYR